MMLHTEGQKRHVALRVVRHDLHAQRLSIKRKRGIKIADVQDDVTDFVDLRHTIPPVLGVMYHRAASMGCRKDTLHPRAMQARMPSDTFLTGELFSHQWSGLRLTGLCLLISRTGSYE